MFQHISALLAATLLAFTPVEVKELDPIPDFKIEVLDLESLFTGKPRCSIDQVTEKEMGDETILTFRVICPKSGFRVRLWDRTSNLPDGPPIFHSDYGVEEQIISVSVNTLTLGRTIPRIEPYSL